MTRSGLAVLVAATGTNAWAQSGPGASRPAGYYVGYLVGIALFFYLVSRIFTRSKKRE
jgi:hypothetical protein